MDSVSAVAELSDRDVLEAVAAIQKRFKRKMTAAAREFWAMKPDALRFDCRIDVDAAAISCQQRRAELRRCELETEAVDDRRHQLSELRSRAGVWRDLVPQK